tara:strand:+ start:4819 stop:5943 length:1125 start_codon:yes stop_codon:yes gene_type:complete
MSEEANTIVAEEAAAESNPMSFDDGVIKVNLNELNKSREEVTEPIQAEEPSVEMVTEEVVQPVTSVIEEITDEVVVEQVQDLVEEIQEAVEQEQVSGIELPENIQKVVEFINETGGSLEDYVKLNTDYASLNEDQLLREYYGNTKPHLEKDDVDFLMEDNFSFDEDLDEERDIRRKKLARTEELAKAKNHLDGLKSKYYEEIKGGSKLAPEQQKAIDFFNRHKKENEEATKVAEKQSSTFNSKTENLFSKDFKGFDFNVGEKKFRFNVNDVDKVKTSQSDINNFVKKFLNENNEMSDAAGYHKSLFTAMNTDKIANHFYEQGKADAVKESMLKAKNIDMSPRGSHEQVTAPNGWKVKSISGGYNSSKLKIRTKK